MSFRLIFSAAAASAGLAAMFYVHTRVSGKPSLVAGPSNTENDAKETRSKVRLLRVVALSL